MKTEKQIRKRISALQELLKSAQDRFAEYDNVEDMHDIAKLSARLDEIKWVVA